MIVKIKLDCDREKVKIGETRISRERKFKKI